MEPEGSLSCSQEPFGSPYPEPGELSSCHPIVFLVDPALYYPPTYAYGDHKLRKIDMSFGTWNVRDIYRIS
jgi:hypothetical protein